MPALTFTIAATDDTLVEGERELLGGHLQPRQHHRRGGDGHRLGQHDHHRQRHRHLEPDRQQQRHRRHQRQLHPLARRRPAKRRDRHDQRGADRRDHDRGATTARSPQRSPRPSARAPIWSSTGHADLHRRRQRHDRAHLHHRRHRRPPVEGSESFTRRDLQPRQHHRRGGDGTGSVTTTIIDNDTASWSIAGSASVTEGDDASYTVSLAGTLQSGETATIDLSLTDGTTTAADHAAVAAAVTAAIGARTDLSFDGTTLTYTGDGSPMAHLVISLAATDDSSVEGSETYTVALANAGSTTGAAVTLSATTTSPPPSSTTTPPAGRSPARLPSPKATTRATRSAWPARCSRARPPRLTFRSPTAPPPPPTMRPLPPRSPPRSAPARI